MNYPQYNELDKLIQEYEEDMQTIRSERLVMQNYPKVLTMSAASLFEFYIKKDCQSFIDNPILSIDPNYPQINTFFSRRKPVADQMFAKLEGYDDNGVEQLCAEPFYNLFGGNSFKNSIQNIFTSEKEGQINNLDQRISGLESLIEQDEKYAVDYIKLDDIKKELENCRMEDAEKAYLSIKLRRNRVAHDYINGLSDTFADIRKFYNIAVLYVVSLQKAIQNLTNALE